MTRKKESRDQKRKRKKAKKAKRAISPVRFVSFWRELPADAGMNAVEIGAPVGVGARIPDDLVLATFQEGQWEMAVGLVAPVPDEELTALVQDLIDSGTTTHPAAIALYHRTLELS